MNSYISRTYLQTEFVRLFSWWVRELASLIPAKVYSMLVTGSNCLVIDVLDTEIRIGRFQGDVFKDLAHIESSSQKPEQNVADVSRMVQQERANQIIFRLPIAKAMVRILPELPKDMENNLEEALYFELEKLTPFRPEELWFDYRICGRNLKNGSLDVQIAMVPKESVLELLTLSQSWGIKPDQVDIVGEDASRQEKFNFLKHAQVPLSSRYMSISLIQNMVALGLLVGVVLFPMFHQYQTLQKVTGQVAQIKIKAENSLIIRNNITNIVSESLYISEYKRNLPSFIEVLEELTKIIPDDAWLVRLAVSGPSVKVSGYAQSASRLIELIESSSIFKDVTPDSSFVRDPKLERERFKFSFQLEHKGTARR
ncbi:MAG: PilN domain-containing protein [Magnetococcales bacterium]|nr:PilN domain-containing protein [Magnetococcales bacterium]